eukprot:GILJ01022355.1.p1 GENE.GILJ01022355.1~~GILJ01022355.1.p1  ORF type:complete len:244 (+),score=31.53 GILJ01022355.1:26-757(+)
MFYGKIEQTIKKLKSFDVLKMEWNLDDYYRTLGIDDITQIIRRALGDDLPLSKVKWWAQQYHRFLTLKVMVKDHDASQLSPPLDDLDAIWHEHILDTRNYEHFATVSNCRLHHNPAGAEMGDEHARQQRRDKTATLMAMVCDEHHEQDKKITDLIDEEQQQSQPEMINIFVKLPQRRTASFLCSRLLPIEETLAPRIATMAGIPVLQQRIIYGGRQLEMGATLDQQGISHNATLDLLARLRGC